MRVQAQGVTFDYGAGAFALAIDALDLPAQSATAIVGSSGSGKSTLLLLLAGILAPRTGSILQDGVDLAALGPRAVRRGRLARVGLVFQDFELAQHLTALENVLVAYDLGGLSGRGSALARAHDLAARCGVAPLLSRLPARLSHGERQRIAVCRALVTGPALVLADEPTASLDDTSARSVVALLTDEAARAGATLVVATHDPRALERLPARVAMDAFAPACVPDGIAR